MPESTRGYWLPKREGGRFAFDAGALCVEFATTGGEGSRKAWETLHEPADLAAWATRSRLAISGLIDPADFRIGPRDFSAARRLREVVWFAINDLAFGRRLRSADLAVLNRAAAAPPIAPRIDVADNGELRTWVTPVTGAQLLSTVARDAIDLFTGPMASRIRQCAGQTCTLVFVDTSRPGQRRWCSMQRCGNIEKQRALRTRRHPGGAEHPVIG